MALSDDLTGFFSDFAVSATAGGTTGDVILNQPSSIAFDGQVIFTDFVAVAKVSDFGLSMSILCSAERDILF